MKIILLIFLFGCFSSNPYERKLSAENIDKTYKEIQESGTEEEKFRSQRIMRLMEIKALREKSLVELLEGKSFSEHADEFKKNSSQ